MSIDQTGLRPYYNPATFNSPLKLRDPPSFSTYATAASSSATNNSSALPGAAGSVVKAGSKGRSGPSVEGVLELDVDFGSTGDTVAEIGRSMARLYGKVFFSQPWRVGRLLLQVGDWSEEEGLVLEHHEELHHDYDDEFDQFEHVDRRGRNLSEFGGDADIPHSRRHNHQQRRFYEEEPREYALRSSSALSFRSNGGRRDTQVDPNDSEEEEEEDETSYFSQAGADPAARGGKRPLSRSQTSMDYRRRPLSRSSRAQSYAGPSTTKKQLSKKRPHDGEYVNKLRLESTNFSDIISALQAQDGLKGLWRGVNTSFLLDAMQVTLEAWLSGFFSSVSGVPDPHFLDISHSPTPGASLATAVTASVVTAVLLAPLSIVRTRMVTTTFETVPRSVRTSIRELPSWLCPGFVLVPTVLHAGMTSAVRKSTSYVLQHLLNVDPTSMPVFYSVLTLAASVFEVGVRLPLETLVRRAHMAYLNLAPLSLLVRPAEYEGVFGTAWSVVSGQERVATLYRGWRVSMLGVISEWGVETLEVSDQVKEQF